VSFPVCFVDRKEGVGWGGTESDSADARLSSVNGPVCQLTVPLLIQYNPVANATTILKRLPRASELLCECHMLGLLTYSLWPTTLKRPSSMEPASRMGVS